MNDDLRKAGQLRRESVPQPACHHFNRGIFQPRNIVQIRVVQFLDDWLHRRADERVVVEPAGVRVHLAFHRYFNREGMPVQSRALMANGHFGEALRSFENEIFGESDFHGAELYRCACGSPIHFRGDFRLALSSTGWHLWAFINKRNIKWQKQQ